MPPLSPGRFSHRKARRLRTIGVLALLFGVLSGAGVVTANETHAQAAAEQFLSALRSGETPRWDPQVPREGRVRVQLVRWGQARGDLGVRQTRALLKDLTEARPILQYRILRVESESRRFALVHTRVVFRNDAGHPEAVRLHLGFRFEGTRWVVRDIRESLE